VSERLAVELPDSLIEAIVEQVTERVLAELQRERGRRWLPVREAAAELGLSEGALRKHIARGGVETGRIGSRIVVDMRAIEGS
jgi:hypothetical protein